MFGSCKGKKSKTNKQPTTSTSTSLESSDQDSGSESIDDVIITKITTGTVDKFGSQAKLNDEDYTIIRNPTGWLTCDIIQAAHVLLQEANSLLEGLQRLTLGQARNYDVVSSDFVQILRTGSDHWVYISSLGCTSGMVNVHYSLYNDVISQEIEEQANGLLGGRLISLDCRYQYNSKLMVVTAEFFLLLLLYVLLLSLIPAMLLLMFQRCAHTYKIVYNNYGKITMFPTLFLFSMARMNIQ